jgi:hypothetical protein
VIEEDRGSIGPYVLRFTFYVLRFAFYVSLHKETMPPTIHFTLGPASWPAPILQGVIAAGVDACRINLSHTQPAQLPEWFAHARAAAAAIGCPLRVGADLRGRKLRVGPLAGGQVTLVPGARFMLIPVAAQAEAPGNGQQAWSIAPHWARSQGRAMKFSSTTARCACMSRPSRERR